MRQENVKLVLRYYSRIPGMVKLLNQERRELEDGYNGLRSASMDGMPHGGTPGKPVEELAVKMEQSGAYERLREIDVQTQILEGDAAVIRGCLDVLNGEYKRLISLRYLSGYSWVRLAVQIETPESTARHWHKKALERLGEALEDTPMSGELVGRASRART